MAGAAVAVEVAVLVGVAVAVVVAVAVEVTCEVDVGVGVGVFVGVAVGVDAAAAAGHNARLVVQLPPAEGQQYCLVPQVSTLPAELQRLSAGELSASGGWQFLSRFGCFATGQASAAGH